MGNSNKFRITICTLITVFALYLLSPTVYELMNPDNEGLPKGMPNTAMKLGLDLKGGVHMVLGVDLNSVVKTQEIQYSKNIEQGLISDKIEGVQVKYLENSREIEMTAPDAATKEKVAEFLKGYTGTVDIVGELNNTLVGKISVQSEEFIRTRARDQSIETIRNRIDEFGIAEPIITKRGEDQILVQFPGAKEPDRLKKLIGQTAMLNFHIVHECSSNTAGCLEKYDAQIRQQIKTAEEAGGYTKDTFKQFSEYRDRINADLKGQLPPDTFVAFERVNDLNEKGKFDYRPFLLSTVNMIGGQYIEDAFVQMNQNGGIGSSDRPVVSFRMNNVGAPMLGKLTSDYLHHYMAIVLDGVVKSAPVIQSSISDAGQITLGTGSLEEVTQEAKDLSIVLRAGALPASIQIQEERVIGPSIGRDAINAGNKALMLSTLFVFLFMFLYYGSAGVLATFVTLINVALIFAILGALGATLTLPGIAGIVLTIGMAVDALIIIYERMREEMRAGRNNRQIIEMGFDKAMSTIVDSNVTTILGAIVLLNYGTGTIRGFAFTLIVGIVTNVFMATFYLKTLFNLFYSGQNTIRIGISKKELTEIGATR